jgi:signal transduction histidine kinase
MIVIFLWSFVSFVYLFPRVLREVSSVMKFLFHLTAILLLFLSFQGSIIKTMIFEATGPQRVTGPLFFIFILFLIFSIVVAFHILYQKYRSSTGAKKAQIKYIITGLSSTILFASVTNLILPAFDPSGQSFVFGPYFTIFFFGSTFYAIARYRLMDIRLVIRRSLIYFVLVVFVTASYSLLTFLIAQYFGGTLEVNSFFVTVVVSVLIVLTLDPLKQVLSSMTDHIFYKGQIDYQEVLRDLSQILHEEVDLDPLIERFTRAVREELKVRGVHLLMANSHGGFQEVGAHAERGLRISGRSSFLEYLRRTMDVVVLEEFQRRVADIADDQLRKRMETVQEELEQWRAYLAIPIVSQGRLSAMFMLEDKRSGETFNTPDITLFTVLTPQIGTALEKARLYTNVTTFNVKLRHEVERATKELMEANTVLQERNNFLLALQKITNLITRSLDLKKMTQMITDEVHRELGYLGCILFLIDMDRDEIGPEAYSQNPEMMSALRMLPMDFKDLRGSFSMGSTLTIQAAKSGQSQIGDRLAEFISPPAPRPTVDEIQKGLGIQSVVATPVFSETEIIGVILFLLDRPKDRMKPTDFQMMRALADQTGIVTRNLRLYHKVQEANEKLKEANEHLKQLDNAKSEFMSIASHQLRTPLSGIMGYLSMLTEGDYGRFTSEQGEVFVNLLDATRRLIRLVNVFLNVTRIEAGRFQLDLAPVEIQKMIEEEIAELELSAQRKHLRLVFHPPTRPVPSVLADSDKVRDVIINLVDNAIKYTEEGEITITLAVRDPGVVISVKDPGVGIEPKEASRLFQKFVRGSGIARIQPDGSGLGLFIAKKVVESHGGKIWVESEGLGKGATFYFSLPLQPTSP